MKLNELTIIKSQKGLKNKDFSAEELTKSCLNKIKETNQELNSFMTVFEKESLTLAKEYDKKLSKNNNIHDIKPLLGIPIALKDNYLTKGLRTTASSKVLDDYIPQYDSTAVSKLKEAGAIIIGKTNMDAWAHGSSTETSDYGPTKNPHDTTRIPGGSSGGSGAAVASDQVIAGTGSETAGSIRGPAAWCGIVGVKPTYGRVSRYGIIAMGSSLDSPGPMTKTVEDSALMLSVMAGHDPNDATTSDTPVPQYHKNLTNNLKGLKIGLPKEYFLDEAQNGVNELVMQSAKELEKRGAILQEVSLPTSKYAIETYTIVQRSEVFSNLARYDGIRYGDDRSHMGEEAKRRIMLGAYALKISKDGKYYKLAQKVRMLMRQEFDTAFQKIDVLLAPTMPSIAPKLGASEEAAMFGELADLLQEPSSLTGITGVTMPCGMIDNMPVGIQFIGNYFEEQQILNAAHSYESQSKWRENVWKK